MLYTKSNTKEILFPLGGIGAGSISLAGNGHLRDWEIKNHPAKGSENGFSHLSLRMKTASGIECIVLNGDVQKDLAGQYGGKGHRGYGYGPTAEGMSGFRHFSEWEFEGDFPVAHLRLSDPTYPARVTLTAWNPMIPNDSVDSSIPAAFFTVAVENISGEDAEITTAFSVTNPFPQTRNTVLPDKSGVFMMHPGVPADHVDYGDLTLTASGGDVFCVQNWYRGGWQDPNTTYWREFTSPEGLHAREYDTDRWGDTCTVAVTANAKAGETVESSFILTWSVPNCYNYWNPYKDENGNDVTWRNWYATKWATSAESNAYCVKNRDMLWTRTKAFTDILASSSLDPVLREAAIANLAVLHSPTVMRLENGELYGWEGARENDGSCEGCCKHVWTYAYAACFLFPDLERSLRDLEYTYDLHESGAVKIRMNLPLEREGGWYMPCVDGQMGGIIKLYRDWKLSGDDEWLRSVWQKAKKALEFAWSEKNPLGWDADHDGVLEGRQHHTLDMEMFGPSSWLEGMYLCALRAGEEIASYLGETDSAAEYRALYENGRKFTESELFNGQWYAQKVDLTDRSIIEKYCSEKPELWLNDVRQVYWNDEAKEIKYQIAGGCEIDQVLGQWHSTLCGLGDIFDGDNLDSALRSVFRHNFRESMRPYTNTWRVFSLNDEAGTVMSVYPEGTDIPAIPIPYNDETMTGFEYSFAGTLLSRGMEDEAKRVVKAIRDRYDGEKRNPWNEIECGSNYARTMASFAFFAIDAGFTFDLPHKKIGFDPLPMKRGEKEYTAFWSVDGAWGKATLSEAKTELEVTEGTLRANGIAVPFMKKVTTVKINGEEVPFTFTDGTVTVEADTLAGRIIIE